jgi:hypothetical protein
VRSPRPDLVNRGVRRRWSDHNLGNTENSRAGVKSDITHCPTRFTMDVPERVDPPHGLHSHP